MSYLTMLRSLKSAGTQGDKSDNIKKVTHQQILSVFSRPNHAANAFGLICITAENGVRSARPTGFKRKGSAMAV
jgi:hypothetical protein